MYINKAIPLYFAIAFALTLSNIYCATPKHVDDNENLELSNNCSIEISDYAIDCNFEGLFFNLEYSAFNISSLEFLINEEPQFITNDTLQGDSLRAFGFIFQPLAVQDYTLIIRDATNHLCADTLILEDYVCDPCQFISFGFSYDCKDDSTYTFTFESRDPNGPVDVFLDSVFVGTHTDGEPDLRLDGLIPNLPGTEILVTACSDFHDCCQERTFDISNCGASSCEISDIELETTCLNDSIYLISISYDFAGIDNDTVFIIDNLGNEYGYFDVNSQPHILTVDASTFINSEFSVIIEAYGFFIPHPVDFTCRAESDMIEIECDSSACLVEFIEIIETNCNDDGTYNLVAAYDLNIFTAANINVNVNGINYNLSQDTISIFTIKNIIPRIESDFDIVTLCLDGYPDNCKTIEYDVSVCTNPCEIQSIEIDSFSCNQNGTYKLFASYDVINPNSDFIEVTINNRFNFFENTGSIMLDSIIPRDFSDYDFLKICLNSNIDCCSELEFIPPNCGSIICPIETFNILEITCNTNGTFNLTAEFAVDTIESYGIEVEVNGVNLQLGSNANSIFTINEIFPDNSDTDFLTVCNLGVIACCVEVGFDTRSCIAEPCEFSFVELDSIGCLQDGYYSLRIDYEVLNANNNTLLEVSVNNGPFEEYRNTGFTFLEDIKPRINSDYDIIVVCIQDKPETCVEMEYLIPAGCVTNECDINSIEILDTKCNLDGTYDLTTFFNLNIFTGSDISVSINGVEYSPALDSLSTITITGITPRPQSDYDIITICVDDFENCCTTLEYPNSICNEIVCGFEYIKVDSIVCTENGIYSLIATYNIVNANNDFIDVFINNEEVQFFENNGSFTLDNITPRPNSDYDFLKICLNDNPDCCQEIEFLTTCEETDIACVINDLEVSDIECIADSIYNLKVTFETNIQGSLDLSYYLNGISLGSTIMKNFPIQLNGLPFSDSINTSTLTICIGNQEAECCADLVYDQPNCLSNGIDESLLEGVSIYPNPVHNSLYIHDIPQEILGFTILNHLGKKIDNIITGPNASLDVSNYPNGIYLIQFYTKDNRKMSRRFMKM